MNCHTYLGAGTSQFGAPDLSSIGAGNQGKAFFRRYVANPADFGNNIMPPFRDLGAANLNKLATFLDASKGPK